MDIKQKSKQQRDALQQGIYKVINPFVRFLIRMGVTPNMVTTIGLLGNVAAAVVMVVAAINASRNGGQIPYGLVTLSGAFIIGFSLFDMLDGQVARLGDMTTRFGAMYDSCLDRYCEMLTVGAVAYYLIVTDHLYGALIAFVALIGSVMVSYVRARAEGIGLECKIGFMQRPERVVITSASILATGICGQAGVGFVPEVILMTAMSVIAVFANLTAFARIGYSRAQLEKDGDGIHHHKC